MPSTHRGKTWLIIEPHFDGHHFPYLEHLVAGALERGLRVVVAVGNDAAQGQRSRAALLDRFGPGAVGIVTVPYPKQRGAQPGALRLVYEEARRRRFLIAAYAMASAAERVDFVFLPYLDWSLFAISVFGAPFGATPFAGITMRQRFHLAACGVTVAPDRMNGVKAYLFRRLLALPTLHRVFTNDETLPGFFARAGLPGADKLVHIPDPSDPVTAEPRTTARRRLNIPEDACVVLAYGYLDARKGMVRLLSWIANTAGGAKAHLLAVGQHDAAVKATFESADGARLRAEGRLHSVDDFIAEADERWYFAAADIVWLGYERFEMMSGVLVKAAQFERAVVFHDYGLIAHYARQYSAPYPNGGACERLVSTLPSGLIVRTFEGAVAAGRLPDHSWSHAVQLMLG